VALQETLAVPDPVTLFGVIAPQARLPGTASVRVTTPEKLFSPLIVIVDGAEVVTATGEGEEAVIVKSWNLKVTVTVWTSGLLVPVIVRL
jgi:hypothetical protein